MNISPDLPLRKRPYRAFVSYSHQDQAAVAALVGWLERTAGIHVWFDGHLGSGSMIATALPNALKNAQSALFVVSQSSAKSGWCREEYGIALQQRTLDPDYRIVAVRLDQTAVPDFLQTTKWIDAVDGKLTPAAAFELLSGFYGDETGAASSTKDLYVSRTWRASEAEEADAVCRLLIGRGYRLVGDAEDQSVFDPATRVRRIISSCGALVAIMPDRGGVTSPYIENEIRLAAELGLPCLLVAADGIRVAPELVAGAIDRRTYSAREVGAGSALAMEALDGLTEAFVPPKFPHYVFYGGSLLRDGELNDLVRRLVELETGLGCVVGAQLTGQHAQQEIIDKISGALLMIADITDDNRNTLIEAGIARGAGTRLHLLTRGNPQPTRFMFRDLEVNFFPEDGDMLGVVHRLVYPYRRRILNREISAGG